MPPSAPNSTTDDAQRVTADANGSHGRYPLLHRTTNRTWRRVMLAQLAMDTQCLGRRSLRLRLYSRSVWYNKFHRLQMMATTQGRQSQRRHSIRKESIVQLTSRSLLAVQPTRVLPPHISRTRGWRRHNTRMSEAARGLTPRTESTAQLKRSCSRKG